MSEYDTDFYAWTQTQAAALRAQEWKTLDLANLAEEIEALGNEQHHAVESRLRILLAHLLKWQHQSQRRRRSWQTSILNARTEIMRRLERQPSLQHAWPEMLAWAYPKARQLAATETGLPLDTFPGSCPWQLAQVLNEDFLPDAPVSENEDKEIRLGPRGVPDPSGEPPKGRQAGPKRPLGPKVRPKVPPETRRRPRSK